MVNMGYFLPSFFQKRILRYALSRLELLETDALDLEKLDIAWGKRSTVELRDVGLKLKVSLRTNTWLRFRDPVWDTLKKKPLQRLIPIRVATSFPTPASRPAKTHQS